MTGGAGRYGAARRLAASLRSRQARPLLVILAVAAVLRLWGIDFGLPGKFRPDEEYLVSRALGFHGGDLNPHFFIYPTLYMYVLSAVYGAWRLLGALFGAFGEAGFDGYLAATQMAPLHLLGRLTTALLGVLGVAATYALGRRAHGRPEGLLAAALLAANYLHVRDSHFATTDVPAALLSTLALLAMVLLMRRGRLRDYLASGALVGLAVATKYPAAALAVPYAVAHLLHRDPQGRRPWSPARARLFLAGAGAGAACSIAASPYLLLDFATVKANFAYQAPFVSEGLPALGMDLGWRWLLGFALWHGAGPALTATFLCALGWAVIAWRRGESGGRAGLLLVAFTLAVCAALLTSRWLFVRYTLPLMPVLAVLVARLLLAVGRRLVPRRSVLAAATAAVVLAAAPAIRAAHTSWLLGRTDTREQARRWLAAQLPPGTAIAVSRAFMYGKPEPPPGMRYGDFGDLAASPGWALLDEAPIPYFHPPLPAAAAAVLAARGRLVAEFDPRRRGRHGAGVYEPPDAFYLPLAGLTSLRRPGPHLRIYQVEAPLAAEGGCCGLLGRYYPNPEWSGDPLLVRVDPVISFSWTDQAPLSLPQHSVEWSGRLLVEREGEHGFRLLSDDGAFLYLDGELVIDNGGEHMPVSVSARLPLAAGEHEIALRYFNSAYTGEVRLFWTPPDDSETLVPEEVLRP